jgi:hypothetical protein
MLVKVAPIKVLYSTPYCQFQNWSENYIKNFKKGFTKLLNDGENPQDNADWPLLLPWMKEVKGIRHRGRGVYLRCPVFTTVQFSLRDEGSSEYICLCEGREILSPNFQTFQDPRHQFHGIGRLVSETLYLFATLALLHIQAELILGTFLPSLKV